MMPARKLEALEIRPYRVRLRTPLRTARGVMEFREGFVVLLRDGDLVGRGEAAPLDPRELPECFDDLRRDAPRTAAARFALELARLDIEAQRRGLPLAKLLDPRAADSVPVSALLCAEAMPQLAREAQRAVADGFRTLKLKVGLQDDFARAAVVRDAAGAGVRLRIDANGAWRSETALEKLRELAPLGIELCEQPTEELEEGLREESPIPIAADELVARDPEGALKRADIVVLKPMLLGGLRPAMALAKKARERGLGVIVTTALDGAIARAGAAHLAAALYREGEPAAGLATGRLLDEPDPLAPREGILRIPTSPGLGL